MKESISSKILPSIECRKRLHGLRNPNNTEGKFFRPPIKMKYLNKKIGGRKITGDGGGGNQTTHEGGAKFLTLPEGGGLKILDFPRKGAKFFTFDQFLGDEKF